MAISLPILPISQKKKKRKPCAKTFCWSLFPLSLGAAPYITSKGILGAAGAILTTESRHQAWIESAVLHGPAWSTAYDTAITVSMAYSAAAQFITSCPSTNVSSFFSLIFCVVVVLTLGYLLYLTSSLLSQSPRSLLSPSPPKVLSASPAWLLQVSTSLSSKVSTRRPTQSPTAWFPSQLLKDLLSPSLPPRLISLWSPMPTPSLVL